MSPKQASAVPMIMTSMFQLKTTGVMGEELAHIGDGARELSE